MSGVVHFKVIRSNKHLQICHLSLFLNKYVIQYDVYNLIIAMQYILFQQTLNI